MVKSTDSIKYVLKKKIKAVYYRILFLLDAGM